MQFAQFLTLFIGSVTAIDVYMHPGADCKGSYQVCYNVNPNSCCGYRENQSSVAFLGIPTDWNLELRSHKNGYCNVLHLRQNHRGPTFACLQQRNAVMTGAGYSFISKKRNAMDTIVECSAKETKCGDVRRPDEVGFADGVKYDLHLLDEEAGNEILAILAAGGSSADVSAAHDIARK